MQDTLPFGAWLRDYRRTRDLTRENLAQLVGCSVETIRKIESGERRPSKQVAGLLAERLDLSPEDRLIFIGYARSRSLPATPAQEHAKPSGQPAEERAIPNNLRTPLTPLIDRQQEVAAIHHYLQDAPVRLLTLVGPPGVGKTRLALQAALELLGSAQSFGIPTTLSALRSPHFIDGIFFVPLAQVTDAALVSSAIARIVGLEDTGTESLSARLSDHLHDKGMLLLLDNFEQVVASAPDVLDLLENCPRLKMLVTSREPLHVPGEQQFSVPPLDPPDLDGPLTADHIAAAPAVALFVQRAQAVEPTFTLSDENAPPVAAICAQLEGLPLAIELVAARVKMLPLQELLKRMSPIEGTQFEPGDSTRYSVLGTRYLGRTLREAIGGSYNLLSEQERRLFARMSVFAGGCTLVAVEAVCNPRGDLGASAFELIASLLDKSLLWRAHPLADNSGESEARFAMLETIREYAAERLAAFKEEGNKSMYESTKRLHVEYYLAMAEAADPQLTGGEQKRWLDRLELDHDNLRAALEWSLGQGDAQSAAQLGVALKRFWEVHNHFAEGRRWLRLILARAESVPPSLKAKVLNAAGALAIAQGDYDEAFSLLDDSLTLQRSLGDDLGTASALNNLGMAALSVGRYEHSFPYFEEGLSLLRKLGDRGRTAIMLGNFGAAISKSGDLERAVQLLNESLAIRRELGNKWGVAAALGNLAEILRAQGSLEQARGVYVEAISLLNELGDKVGVAKTMVGFAAIAIAGGQPERALKLLGSVDDLLRSSGGGLAEADQVEHMTLLEASLSALDVATASASWASGRDLSLEQAISYALNE